MSADANLNGHQLGPYLHGSPEQLSPGDMIRSAHARGVPSSAREVGNSDRQVYFTTDRSVAEDAAIGHGNDIYGWGNYTPHVYRVEPTGKHYADKHSDASYRSAKPLRVVGEV